ncbi:MAG: leucyl aminopeptidase, partial [Actinomycetota bacterium]|nr:leucyl aminopeptidase [Actinomycetota bacterium]
MAPSFRIVADAPKADVFVVPVFTDARPGPGADLVDDAIGGSLAEFMRETEFEGKRGEVLAVPTGGRLRARSVLLLGVGDRDTFDAAAIRRAGAVLAKRAAHAATVATTLLDAIAPDVDRALAAQAFAEGVSLGRYQFLRYKSDAKASKLARVLVVTKPEAKVRAGLARGARIAEAVVWARDLINEPAAAKSPADVAELAKGIARTSGLKAKVYAGEQLVRARMGGVLGVGNGSERPPRFLRLEYAPANAKGTLALVGKGVVFDSGGLSLKTAGGMETMKTDMSGAAAVIAAMSTLRDLGVKTRVIAYVPLVENMPSGAAMRPGDVLTMRNGKTVEVLNTDAEGRLILADALSLAAEDEPDAVVDLATLTGACVVALGEAIAGLMGT